MTYSYQRIAGYPAAAQTVGLGAMPKNRSSVARDEEHCHNLVLRADGKSFAKDICQMSDLGLPFQRVYYFAEIAKLTVVVSSLLTFTGFSQILASPKIGRRIFRSVRTSKVVSRLTIPHPSCQATS